MPPPPRSPGLMLQSPICICISMEYASFVWDHHTANRTNQLEGVQRRDARYVTGVSKHLSSPIHMMTRLNWAPLQVRRQQAKLVMPYKITHRRIANTSLPYLIPYQPATRGHSMRFRPLLSSRINCHQSSFFPSSMVLWNALPAYMVQMETALQPFCRKVNFTCFYYWHPSQHQVWKY